MSAHIAYLVGDAGISPESKARAESASETIATLISKPLAAMVLGLNSETVPRAALATMLALATAVSSGSAGTGSPNTLPERLSQSTDAGFATIPRRLAASARF